VDIETGHATWTFPTGSEVVGTPAVAEELVCFASCDAKLYALNVHSGQSHWTYETQHSLVDASPAIAAGSVFLGGKDGYLRALDLATGREQWQVFRTGRSEPHSFSSPVVAAGVVYGGCSDGTLNAWDAQTGQELWQITIGTTTNWTSPALADGLLCIGGGSDQRVYLFH
jgi:outer membrane protein assembly factor BamB